MFAAEKRRVQQRKQSKQSKQSSVLQATTSPNYSSGVPPSLGKPGLHLQCPSAKATTKTQNGCCTELKKRWTSHQQTSMVINVYCMAKRPHCSHCSVVQIIYQMLTEMHASAKANPPNSDYKLSQTGAELEAIILIQIRRDPATQ